MEQKSQPLNKVRDEHNPLARLWDGDHLILVRNPVCYVCVKVARAPETLHVFLRDGGDLPRALRTRSNHCGRRRRWWTGWELRALELGDWEAKARGEREVKGGIYVLL